MMVRSRVRTPVELPSVLSEGFHAFSHVLAMLRGVCVYRIELKFSNRLTPNDPYRVRTAPLTCKVAFYIFIQQI